MASLFAVEKITDDSQTIVDMFLECYGPKSSKKTYVNGIRRLQEDTGLIDLTDISSVQYKEVAEKLGVTNSRAVTSFVQFMFSYGFIKNEKGFEECYWNKEELRRHFEDLKNNRASIRKNEYHNKLSLQEIEKLILFEKNILDTTDYESIRLAFCFHALFFDGISTETLRAMDLGDMKNGCIKIKDGEYSVPETYWDMIQYYADKRESNTKLSSINVYIDTLGERLNIKDLMPKTVSGARKQNLFKCPQCGEEYLSFSEYWRSINGKMVCIDCAQKYANSDEKKNSDQIEPISNIEVNIISNDEKENVEVSSNSYEQLCKKLKVPKNFDEWNEHIKLIGKIGEKYVLEQEKSELIRFGREDLSELVDGSIALDNMNGFDILSYCATKKGKIVKCIEVKSTEGKLETPF